MDKEDNLKCKLYELVPVGTIKLEHKQTYVNILPQFKPALKYLELFSHALIFLISDQDIIHFVIAEIINLDAKKGILKIDDVGVPDDSVILDVKPYFPCEDRVKEACTPAYMSSWAQWRNVDFKVSNRITATLGKQASIEQKYQFSCNQVGSIRKTEGEYFLELNHSNVDIINGLEGFSHIKILWWFDKFDKKTYREVTECNPPYENAPRTGIFASRSPVRPNPIAVTTARILEIDRNQKWIKVSGLDAFDKTPIINIIPYIPAYDRVKEYRVPQWLKHWPEWLDDRETNVNANAIKIMDSNIERINQLMITENTITKNLDYFLEMNTQDSKGNLDEISIKGARQNNLKNINCTIPKNKITVITGVSGSGKSSLAFDTIYSESQRRFMDSLSTAGRTLFEQMEKPDFDQISGLPPAIAIEQKSIGRNPRSTVGTMTDIYDYLKLLYTRIGTRHCPECGRAITPLKIDEIANILSRLLPNTLLSLRPFNTEEIPEEFVVPKGEENRRDFIIELNVCLKKALLIGNGAIVVTVNQTEEFLFQSKEICYHCNRIFFELTTSTFSFNNPESMCPICKGLGVKLEIDSNMIVANPDISILDGASSWWGNLRKHRQNPNANWMKGEILALAEEMGVDLELPWKQLPESFKTQALYGSEGRKISFTYNNSNGRKGEIVRPVEGAFNSITRLFQENSGDTANRIALNFMREMSCPGCHEERLSAEGRLVSIAKTRFPETVIMTIEELRSWVIGLPKKLSEREFEISLPILKELNRRLQKLIDIGVPYLTLDRSAPTLSGGEAQRLRLATQLGSGITNMLYVLDEPSIGLHSKDHKNIIKIMQQLRAAGNTVIIVEHDADTMLAADKIIDIGPGAGVHGGLIVAEGTAEEIMQNPHSETGRYLKGLRNIENPTGRERKQAKNWIKLKGARHNNLKNLDVAIPLGIITCVTGVSGSGKSSLVSKILYPALAKYLNNSADIPGDYDSIEGLEGVDKIINITQQPIGRTPRSNPATYTGVFDEIRNVFALTKEAKNMGYKQNKFSFNSKEGQCEACKGEGRKCVPMHFMPDIWVECSFCHGKRYNTDTLDIKYKGKTIADVLDMNIEEAVELFADNRKIKNILQTLKDVGLGYIKLGQSALTLSGGEAQRIKLAKELSKSDTGKTIYILDEPTTGLHFLDIQNLQNIMRHITQAGNTILVIEHNLDIIMNADWIIDLGPEGGNAGGCIVAQGTPEEVAEMQSYTGTMLKEYLYT